PVPGLVGVHSTVAVPATAGGQVVGVLVVESDQPVAFDDDDVHALQAIASLVAQAVEAAPSSDEDDEHDEHDVREEVAPTPGPAPGPATHVRFFPVDGSTFLDGDYLIKGVAGRILWSLVRQHQADGRVDFTNRELRLDPSLELPPHRSNLENRLLLLQRRLEEREAPIRIERTGRGRLRLHVSTPLRLDAADDPSA